MQTFISVSEEVEMIDGFVQDRQTYGWKDYFMMCYSSWTEAEALMLARLGRVRFTFAYSGDLSMCVMLTKVKRLQ